jgi:putative ABC transport system permease protein
MTARSFILRGLHHYRGAYLGVLLGAALGAMVLLGALFAGDSVRFTLRQIASERTGNTSLVLAGGENFFRAALADTLAPVAPVLHLRSQVDTPAGRSTGQVNLFGVDPRFWALHETPPAPLTAGNWAINRELARTLDLAVGDSLVIRLGKPGMMSRDAPLSGEPEELITLRGTVAEIRADAAMGRFSLEATQLPTPAIFLPLETLATAIDRPGMANLLIFSGERDPAGTTAALRNAATLEDYGLSLKSIPLANATEIRTNRIFLPPAIEEKLRARFPEAQPVVTYLVNTLAANGRQTPYSMVTGVDPAAASFLPADLGPDEIVLNSWEAEDLAAGPGDPVTLTYFTLGTGNRLVEKSSTFTVRSVIALDGLAADRLWMPDFPGIAEADNSADWTPGLPLDLSRIREKDETYWDDHRGTPKAFIPYPTARTLWSNRWGAATSLRLPAATPDVERQILDALNPADAGLLIRDLGAESRRAAASPVDIAGLFLSMSFFLILAATALTAMLFRFNVEQRNHESGLLAALGIPARKILRWRLMEGFIVVVCGSVLGAGLAIAYTRGLLMFLETIWNRGGEKLFRFHVDPASLGGGLAGFIVLMMTTIWLVTRSQARRSASLRLEAATEEITRHGKSCARWILPVSTLVGVAAAASVKLLGAQIAFFLVGFAFLVAGLSAYAGFLARARRATTAVLDPPRLAALNAARRPLRSLVVVGSLAAGLFLVVSVTAFQKHGGSEWLARTSGTGGFAFWIETTTPVHRSAAADSTTDILRLGNQRNTLGQIVPFRVGRGDDASCFNLNSVARPRLLATDTTALEQRGAFTIKATAPGIQPTWAALRDGDPGVVRAFIDETTLLWVLKKNLGDRIDYTDETGASFPVEIAGTLDGSIFQGSFIVDEQRFLARFPGTGGYQLFLADAAGDLPATRVTLQKSLTDLGATLTTTAERLAAFHSVENTYISIFNVLGGLGVILGSAGLGLVTARNLAERRNEFAQLRQLGIPNKIIRSLVVRETRLAILWALAIGIASAAIAIFPTLPATNLLPTLAAISTLVALFLITATTCAALAWRTSAKH